MYTIQTMELSQFSARVFYDRYAREKTTPPQQGDLAVVMVPNSWGGYDPTLGKITKIIDKEIFEVTPFSSYKLIWSDQKGEEVLEGELSSEVLVCSAKEVKNTLLAKVIDPSSDTPRKLVQNYFVSDEISSSLFEAFRFVPAGRIWANYKDGEKSYNSLFNCYVIPAPHDSREGIMDHSLTIFEIMARGGGVGFSLSSLRPKGSHIQGIGGISEGSVSWGGFFSDIAGKITQGGTRKGAEMITMDVWHPDIFDFISAKQDHSFATNCNMSVMISDDFMEAVEKDEDWDLVFPDFTHPAYDTQWDGILEHWKEKGYPIKVYKTVRARDLFDAIVQSAWASAEPGVIFRDTYNKMNNTWWLDYIRATNPCGEQGLPDWGVCNLGSVNLASHVIGGELNWELLKNSVEGGVRFLDRVIDSFVPIPHTKVDPSFYRRVGLGIMGLAEMLAMLGIRYGSQESLDFIEKVMDFIRYYTYRISVQLAKEKGAAPFLLTSGGKLSKRKVNKLLQSKFIQNLPRHLREEIKKYGLRNATLLSVAPTGTIGAMVGTSTGIEPYPFRSYKVNTNLGSFELRPRPLEKGISEDLVPTIYDLTPREHVLVQAAIQKYIDTSISKTINLPASATVEDVAEVYTLGWKLGLKGLTVYRESSRDAVIESSESDSEQNENEESTLSFSPEDIMMNTLSGDGQAIWQKIDTPFGKIVVFLRISDGLPYDIIVVGSKSGTDIHAYHEAIGRLSSVILRMNSPIHPFAKVALLVDQLRYIGGGSPIYSEHGLVASVPDAVAIALEKIMDNNWPSWRQQIQMSNTTFFEEEGESDELYEDNHTTTIGFVTQSQDMCPRCGAKMIITNGCGVCPACKYSSCG